MSDEFASLSVRYDGTRDFDERIKIRTGPNSRNVSIIAIREGIDTIDGNAAAIYFRQIETTNIAYWADSTSKW